MNIDELKERYKKVSHDLNVKKNTLYNMGMINFYSIMESTKTAKNFYTSKAELEIYISQLETEKDTLLNFINKLTRENIINSVEGVKINENH